MDDFEMESKDTLKFNTRNIFSILQLSIFITTWSVGVAKKVPWMTLKNVLKLKTVP